MLLHTARIEVTVADTEDESKQTYAAISSVEGGQHVVAGSGEHGVVVKDGLGELRRAEGDTDELGVPVDDADFGFMDGPCGEGEYGQREQTP
jgi:hypothetical protein